ncbi:hypothetical protein, partial [Streptomyces gardneri]|uniref:hypothetical protein n=1 Tax=Streptomyces gardneri TaxID=66892 RepID=UPI001C3FE6F4
MAQSIVKAARQEVGPPRGLALVVVVVTVTLLALVVTVTLLALVVTVVAVVVIRLCGSGGSSRPRGSDGSCGSGRAGRTCG